MGKNNKKNHACNENIEKGVAGETEQVAGVTKTNDELCNGKKVMTDSEIAQKYHLDEHSWEGTVAIWKIKKELGIK